MAVIMATPEQIAINALMGKIAGLAGSNQFTKVDISSWSPWSQEPDVDFDFRGGIEIEDGRYFTATVSGAPMRQLELSELETAAVQSTAAIDHVDGQELIGVSLSFNAPVRSIELQDSVAVSVYAVNFFTGKFEASDMFGGFHAYLDEAHFSETNLIEIGGGSVIIDGVGAEFSADYSTLDSLSMPGFGVEANLYRVELGQANFGPLAEVDLSRSSIADLDLGPFGDLELYQSFVKGQVGYGTSVEAWNSEMILTLDGGNSIEQIGGQGVYKADNGTPDEFIFGSNALADVVFGINDKMGWEGGATALPASHYFGVGKPGDPLTQIEYNGSIVAGLVVDDGYVPDNTLEAV